MTHLAASMASGMPFHKKQTETKKECRNALIVEVGKLRVKGCALVTVAENNWVDGYMFDDV